MNRPARILHLAAAFLAFGAAPAAGAQQIPTGFPAACGPGEVQVLLLGVYHFAGSGTDAVQAPAEDVLSPGRQAELEELAARLARWAPEQVAVEWPFSFADSTTARYERYASTGTSQSRNEVVQIGFRLARRLGIARCTPSTTRCRSATTPSRRCWHAARTWLSGGTA